MEIIDDDYGMRIIDATTGDEFELTEGLVGSMGLACAVLIPEGVGSCRGIVVAWCCASLISLRSSLCLSSFLSFLV